MMDKLFQHPGWLKVISLVGAVLLWAYVMPTYTKETIKTFYEVPLRVNPHPTFEVFEGPDTTVQIQAKGTGLAVGGLKQEQLIAEVDLSQVQEPGKPTQVEVQVRGPEQISYIVSPRTFTVTLIEHASEWFPVSVEPEAKTVVYNGREYRYKATLEKDRISLSGRSDFINMVKQVRVFLDDAELKPTNETIVKTVTPLDAAGKEVEKLTRPQMIVTLEWEELPPGKAFKVQPLTKGTLPDGLVVVRMEPEPQTVTVRAATVQGTLPETAIIETEPIDLTGRKSTFNTTIRLTPPQGTTTAIETVNVRVVIEEIIVDKVFKGVPLTRLNAATNADVILADTDVDIRLKGPYSVLAKLDASAIQAFIDLEDVREGRQTLPIKVTVPPGVTEFEVDPAVIEVTITVH